MANHELILETAGNNSPVKTEGKISLVHAT